MKLVTSEVRNAPSRCASCAALLSGGRVVDLGAAHAAAGQAPPTPCRATMVAFLEAGARGARGGATRRWSSRRANPGLAAPDGRPLVWRARRSSRLLPAVPRPGKIIHTSVNFRSHKAEVATGFSSDEWKRQDWGSFHYQHPTGFLQAPSSTVGTDAEVVIPRFTEQLDYEIEIATIIGRRREERVQGQTRSTMSRGSASSTTSRRATSRRASTRTR